MTHISGLCHKQRQKSIKIMPENRLMATMSTLIIRWLFYVCFLSLHLSNNFQSTVVRASYEAEELLNELDRPSE